MYLLCIPYTAVMRVLVKKRNWKKIKKYKMKTSESFSTE